jgi:hypothetical protein
MIRRTLVATIAASALLISMTTGTVLARPVYVFQAVLTGDAEVPGPGDADAIGHVVIMTEPANDRICWVLSWNRVDGTVFAAHIHGPATADQAAGVLLPLIMDGTFGGTGITQDCMSSPDLSGLIDAIVANPQLYYVNVHSLPAFPGGAIRGQLG